MTSDGHNTGSWFAQLDASSLLNTLGDSVGVWAVDFKKEQVFFSPFMADLHGFPKEQMTFQIDKLTSLIHPDDVPVIQESFESHLSKGTPHAGRFRIRHTNGKYIRCRFEANALLDADGTPSSLVGITTDETSEAAVLDALQLSEKRLSDLATHFDGAIFRYTVCADGSDRIDYMSAGAERVWGLTSSEIIGDPSKVWATVHPDDVGGVRAAFEEGAGALSKLIHRWRVVLPDGYNRWIECRATPNIGGESSIVWDGFVIDITDAVEAREQLREKTEMLGQAQKLEAIGQIAGGIAHDVNNLLAVVMGNTELMELDDDPEMVSENRHAIIEACKKGSELTRRLLSFARKARLEPKLCDVNEIVLSMIPLLRRTMPENIKISFASEQPGTAFSNIDVSLLESSLLNLVLNARDAMPEGGSIDIRVGSRRIDLPRRNQQGSTIRPGDYVVLSVRDTGTGIPDDQLPKVAEPFFSTKGPELGSGLGLAMVDGFADQSGGLLQINSTVGTGTKVSIFVPASESSPSVEGKRPKRQEREMLSGRVLLVEDDPSVLRVVAQMMKRMGLDVVQQESGEAALKFCTTSPQDFDLVVSDIVMPGKISGPSLIRALRKQKKDLPAILISGYSAETLDQDMIDRGDLILAKPVAAADLQAAIRTRLQTERAYQRKVAD